MPKRPPKFAPKFRKPKETGGRRCASISSLQQPGDFCFLTRDKMQDIYELACIFPGQTKPSGMIVKRVENVVRAPQLADHVWNWDGNEDTPTVNPKISSKDMGKPWNGFLVGGKFVAV